MGYLRVGRPSFPLFSAPTGGAQVNIGDDSTGGFLNAIDTGSSFAFGGGATPAQLDVNGYPGTTLTFGQTISFGISILDSFQGANVWVFKWTPAGDAVYFLNSGGWNVNSSSGCTVTGSGTTLITMTAGVPARIEFTWKVIAGGSISTEFRAASYAPNSPRMVLCRLSDESKVDNGKYFSQELLDLWGAASLRTVRTMPWTHSIDANRATQSLWAYRTTPSSLAWRGGRFPPGCWAGSTSGTNQYTVSLPTNSGAGGWVDGEVIQANLINAATAGTLAISNVANNGSGLVRVTVPSTATLTTGQQVYISGVNGVYAAAGVWTITVINGTTFDLQGSSFSGSYINSGFVGTLTLTVTGKTGGTKLITNDSGNAAGTSVVAGMATFTYDALLNVVKWRGGNAGTGITGGVPVEVQVALANELNLNLWTTFPTYAEPTYDYAKSMAAIVRDNLANHLTWYPEYTNETWNSGFPQTAYMINQGNVLGISGQSMYSLRVRQMMEAISTVWTATGRSASTLARVIAWQGFGDGLVTSHRLNSSELNTATNSKLLAYTGSINYTTNGQRAVDFAEVGAYATYLSGTAFQNGFNSRYQLDGSSIATIQQLADLFNANPNDATAFAILDNDLRQGTIRTQPVVSVAGTTITIANGTRASDNTVTVSAGGSGYNNGTQILTVLGGTCSIQPQVSVEVVGGVVTSANFITNAGQCATAPTNPASTSGGGGTGATLTLPYTSMYSNGNVCMFTVAPGGTMYTGITANTPYFIVNVSGNTFGVSSTYNGTPIALSGGSGTIYVGVLVNQTMLDLARYVYQNVGGNTSVNPGWEQVAASYDSYRASVSRPNLRIECYEGGLEAKAPTTAQCTSMQVLVGGSAATASAALTAGLSAYKNNTLAETLATDQLNTMMGRNSAQPLTYNGGAGLPHSKTPSWFVMTGPGQWGLLPGGIDTTPYKTYNAVAAFH